MNDIDISHIIGLLIALFALVYSFAIFIYELFFKKKGSVTSHKKRPEEKLIEQILLNEEEAEEEPVTKHSATSSLGLSPHPEEKFTFQSSLDHFTQKSSVDEQKLDIHLRVGEELVSNSIKQFGLDTHFMKKKPTSRIQKLFHGLPSKRIIIIAKEIIDPPIGFR